jgi:enoyl-CoA hydratase/carnithine racemase
MATNAEPLEATKLSRKGQETFGRLEACPMPVVVGIDGYALGGGLQLALSCDIRVSTPSAEIDLPATNEGLIPGLATMRLPRYIGMGRAKKMVLLGNNIDGEEALRIGLVDHLVDEDDFREGFEEVVEEEHMDPELVPETVLHLIEQPPRCRTFELDIHAAANTYVG